MSKKAKTARQARLPLSDSGHNITLIYNDGSPGSTQIWEGGAQAAAAYVLKAIEVGRHALSNFDRPVLYAFITSHQSAPVVYSYDCSNSQHTAELAALANGIQDAL